MKNLLAPEDIEWKFIHSLGLRHEHIAQYVNSEFGLSMEQVTKKKDEFTFGSVKTYYFIDGQKKEYTDLQKLCDDWNEIKNFDDPENEIVWVKKIVKKRHINQQFE